MNTFRWRVMVSSVTGLALILGISLGARAETVDGARQKLGATNQQIDSLRAQVSERAQVAESLQAQIDNMNFKIESLKRQISTTQLKIAAVNHEIAGVEAKMAVKKGILQQYIRNQSYEPDSSTFEVLVTSDNLSSFVDRKEYLNQAQERVQKLIADILETKKDLDKKKADLSALSDDLIVQQNGIDAQRASKNELLGKTKGEQANYEALLATAEEARNRLSVTISNLMGGEPLSSRGRVQAGDVIGREGSTGFSTGSHVHFGVYVNKAAVNPHQYLNSGRIIWPLVGPVMSQDFGPASWSNAKYSFHDGIDISQGYGSPVRAACSGNIILNSFQPDGFGHYIVIDCGGGLWVLTGHMQT